MNWQDASVITPNKKDTLLVIDSWNIAENDQEAAEADDGNVVQNFMSFRTVMYDEQTQRWVVDGESQRVRFQWYMVISLPEKLVEQGFHVSNTFVVKTNPPDSFKWDVNTLTLYNNCWHNQPLNKLMIEYPNIIATLHPTQVQQYNYWLSLSTEQRNSIIAKQWIN